MPPPPARRSQLLENGNAAADERIAVARTLGEVKAAESLEPLMEVSLTAADSRLQRAALTAVSAFADLTIAERLLGHFPKFPEDVRPAFFDLMLSRIEWTRQLADAISSGVIAPAVIPSDVARAAQEASRRSNRQPCQTTTRRGR